MITTIKTVVRLLISNSS